VATPAGIFLPGTCQLCAIAYLLVAFAGAGMKKLVICGALSAIIASPLGAQNAAPVSAPAQAAAAKPRTIPSSEFAREQFVNAPVISPDGKHLSGRVTANGKVVVGVFALDGSAPPQFVGLPASSDLRWYRWAGNDRLLISMAKTVPYFDDEAEMTRLILWDLKTGASKLVGSKDAGLEGDDLLYVDPAGQWILLSFQKSVYDYPSVSRVDLASNKIVQVVHDRSDVWEWYADSAGVVRTGIGFGTNGWNMIYRSKDGEQFRTLGRAKYDDEDAALDLMRLSGSTDEGFVLNNKETGRYALYRYNFASKTLGEKVLDSPTNDITDYQTTEDGTQLKAAWFTDERDRIVWYDPAMKKVQAEIDAAIKGNENWIVSRSRDDSAMIIWTGNSNNPGSYYVYRPAEGLMKRLARINDSLKPAELAPSRYVSYTARDGLKIPAYLTLPLGRPAKGLPLIVLPHGGPYGVRDTPDYDPEVQFLANRGYAVLQPNYRGSDGYGKDFYAKGEGQWGRAMQDDLDDGMDWLVKDGTVDAKRVCIVGASYGGYAALWGATRNPERYRCAASFAGVSDLKRQLSYQLAFKISTRYRKDWRKTVQGDPKFDPKTVSPLFTVDQLKIPVLLAHGDDDQTVPFKQSKLYVDALHRAGKQVEFAVYPGEGHGFSSTANLKDWLDRLEAFLNKYNPS
jgi:dipeptidyl aminopeptidase/acylaminoacyl peptidase